MQEPQKKDDHKASPWHFVIVMLGFIGFIALMTFADKFIPK
jgi:hypothetical protein